MSTQFSEQINELKSIMSNNHPRDVTVNDDQTQISQVAQGTAMGGRNDRRRQRIQQQNQEKQD